VLDIHYLANMVGHRENSATRLMKEMTVVTNSRRGVDFATYYIVEHDTVEDEKKKLGLKTYQIVAAAIDSTD